MRFRIPFAALALSLAVGACNQDSPTATSAIAGQQSTPELQKTSRLFKNIPVTGKTADGRVLHGVLTITQFGAQDLGNDRGQLTVSGTLKMGGKTTSFTGVPATLLNAATGGAATAAVAAAAPTCSILDLDIGPIHLDLLGLVVDLAPVHLDITGQTGQGQLLGNLLCAVAGLLDPQGTGPLTELIGLLNQINDILAGL